MDICTCDHIAEELKEIGAKKILFLGTKSMMTDKPMREYFSSRHGIEVMSVDDYPVEVDTINYIIIEELRQGIVTFESKEYMMNFVYQFPADSDSEPDAIVLGCTELDWILDPDDLDIPIIV